MTRYYFDTENGELLVDEEGVELSGLRAAKSEALALMGDLIRDRDECLWQTGLLRLTVKDCWRKPVFTVETRIDHAPAAYRVSPPEP